MDVSTNSMKPQETILDGVQQTPYEKPLWKYKDSTRNTPDDTPAKLDLTQKARIVLQNNKNESIFAQANNFLINFYQIQSSFINQLYNVPSLYAINCEDGSFLIEWIFPDFRIGFSFEENKNDSSWYIVSKQNLGFIDASGDIVSEQQLIKLILWIIAFVIVHK